MNKVLLIGRLTNEVRSFSTPNGVKYVRGTLAVSRYQGGNEITDFIPFVAWREAAISIEQYSTKGTLLSIEGRFTSSRYTDKQGNIINSYEVTVENFSLLESRKQREARELKQNETFVASTPKNTFNKNKMNNAVQQQVPTFAGKEQPNNVAYQNENQTKTWSSEHGFDDFGTDDFDE
ncbi:single-stranded DNA-binding protein [Mycoplasma sp. Mirounga ES2805-ORL]|uniref:single-stranded DNA-binding protein n=1 Tax=Mycoplasma sp. Mirounga ES2805-ORL TaxID=754514 RepID=UPI00197C0D85|nr:single-stranded DNA-binding protein [Mycoplasma sp. Mirounga ES2805-ORL]QSF13635.1 single-stranded DNA-binding protein [Mycoplasma sp. Mirounga ES2805-ORL]